MKTLLIAGYSAFDLGIFDDKDPKLFVIKTMIRQKLEAFASEGLEWLIFGGNLGFEDWVLQVALEMKPDYDLKLATIFPFKTHGQNWNEANQAKLAHFQQADFVQYAYDTYQEPRQFRDYHTFLMTHADGAFVFYDDAHETKLKYLVTQLKAREQFTVQQLDFDALQDLADDLTQA
ncbi:MAG: SLOG family protein [Streptococcaceae bacterium]|jgi:uncharacterized phage-like protein YoqJ|nr:SLOG family protein [Streptococcaceae bacterium]